MSQFKEKYLLCAHCSGKDLIMMNDENQFWISCINDDCLASGPIGGSEREAINKWNKRCEDLALEYGIDIGNNKNKHGGCW